MFIIFHPLYILISAAGVAADPNQLHVPDLPVQYPDPSNQIHQPRMPGPPHLQQGAGVIQQNPQIPGPVVVMQPGQMMPVGHPGMMQRHIQPGQVQV